MKDSKETRYLLLEFCTVSTHRSHPIRTLCSPVRSKDKRIMGGFIESTGYSWFNRIGMGLCVLLALYIAITHTVRAYQFMTDQKKKGRGHHSTSSVSSHPRGTGLWKRLKHMSTEDLRKVSHLFTIITLFIYFLANVNMFLDKASIYPKSMSCRSIIRMSALFSHYGKGLLYIVLVVKTLFPFLDFDFD